MKLSDLRIPLHPSYQPPPPPMPRPAREIVIAPRMPAPPKNYQSNPFTTLGDVVVDCNGVREGKPCGWHAMGPRDQVKKAYDEHYKLYHSDEVGTLLLNQPRQ